MGLILNWVLMGSLFYSILFAFFSFLFFFALLSRHGPGHQPSVVKEEVEDRNTENE